MVLLTVDTLVLHQIVEPGLVCSDAQVLLNIVLLLLKLVLIEATEDFIRLGALFVRQSVDLGHSCLIVRSESAFGLEVLTLGGRTA